MNNRIDNKPAIQYASTRSLNDSAGAKGGSATQRAGQSDQTDRLSLSSGAGRLQSLIAKAEAAPDVNQAKVDAIKTAISQGQYAVDADSLAARMLGVETQMGELSEA